MWCSEERARNVAAARATRAEEYRLGRVARRVRQRQREMPEQLSANRRCLTCCLSFASGWARPAATQRFAAQSRPCACKLARLDGFLLAVRCMPAGLSSATLHCVHTQAPMPVSNVHMEKPALTSLACRRRMFRGPREQDLDDQAGERRPVLALHIKADVQGSAEAVRDAVEVRCSPSSGALQRARQLITLGQSICRLVAGLGTLLKNQRCNL